MDRSFADNLLLPLDLCPSIHLSISLSIGIHTYYVRFMLSTVSHGSVVVGSSQDQQRLGCSQQRFILSAQRRVVVLSRRLDQRSSYSMGQCFSIGGEHKGRRGLRTTARAAARANGEPMKVMIAGAPGTSL